MQRKSKILISVALICIFFMIFFTLYDRYKLVPYIPVALVVDRGRHNLIYDKSMLNKELGNNICQIFEKYGEYYEKRDDGIWIRNYLLKDMDLLQNYTCKAGGNTPRIVEYPVTP